MLFSNRNKKQSPKKGKENSPFVTKLGDVKHNKLNESSYKLEWVEDALLSGRETVETVSKNFDFSRIKWVALGFSLFLAMILSRAGWLQVVKGEYYASMAEGNRIRTEKISPQRGIIYDRNFTPLVRNVANFILYLVPADLPGDEKEKDELLEKVVNILNSPIKDESLLSEYQEDISNKIALSDIEEKLEEIEEFSPESYSPLFITDNIPYEKAMKLHLKSNEWGGVVLSNKNRREYILAAGEPEPKAGTSTSSSLPMPDGEEKIAENKLRSDSLSHILGYTGKINKEELEKAEEEYSALDYVGKTGVEHFRESELRGEKGKRRIEVDAIGKEKKILSKKEAEDGNNVVLTIDSSLQYKIGRVLSKYIEKIDSADAAAGIAMDPETGEILALVSIPAYNNNFFAQGITSEKYNDIIDHPSNPLFNRAIGGEYPPGSVFKPVMSAAGLEEGLINERTSFESTGGIRVSKWFFPDWRAEGHGITDVKKAIAESVNTFFYYLGGGYNDFTGLGVKKIIEYSSKFGLGSETGINLSSESDGFLPSRKWKEEEIGEGWYIGDTYHLSIGQGFLLTSPIQVANYTSALANKGVLYKPFLVKETTDPKGNKIKEFDPEEIRKDFIEERNMEIVRQGMRQAVTKGSCAKLYDLPVKVAGKTGTAQWANDKTPHSWFTGFAPYQDPEIVLTVLVEKGGDSEKVSVPAAKEILQWYFDRKSEKEVE
ncbi:MAG: penicillin-binding protein 2 [Patescibacteria group bacterium]